MNFAAFIELLRPKQWVKNLFVVAPLVFSHSFLNISKIEDSLIAFVLFSLATSGVYASNDLVDLPYDRAHALKRMRPLARGAISPRWAIMIAGGLLGSAFIFSYLFSPVFSAIVALYVVLNFLYTFWLKHLVLLDMFSVALGFILRVMGGIVAINVFLSPWILGATFFIALFLISVKRLRELDFVELSQARPVLRFYTKDFLRYMVFTSLILTIAIFMLYSFLEVRHMLFLLTILPVVYGLFRFLWLIESGISQSDNPTDIIFGDRPLQLAIIIFGIMVISVFTVISPEYASTFFIK